jgi:hypothetical protein
MNLVFSDPTSGPMPQPRPVSPTYMFLKLKEMEYVPDKEKNGGKKDKASHNSMKTQRGHGMLGFHPYFDIRHN